LDCAETLLVQAATQNSTHAKRIDKRHHAASKLVERFPNFVFTEHGEPQAFNGVGRLDWGFGPAGEEAVITGTSLVLKGDKIGAIYTFLNQRKK
jgi:hypothetical protein